MNEKNIETAGSRDRRVQLYLEQKRTLDTFLAKGAITKAQYEKSLGDLTIKMGMRDYRDR